MLQSRGDVVRFKNPDCNVVVFEISGSLLPGSEGNASVKGLKGKLDSFCKGEGQGAVGVVFDFRQMEFPGGDSLATLWLPLVARKQKVGLVVNDAARGVFESLVRISLPVPIFSNPEAALTSICPSA